MGAAGPLLFGPGAVSAGSQVVPLFNDTSFSTSMAGAAISTSAGPLLPLGVEPGAGLPDSSIGVAVADTVFTKPVWTFVTVQVAVAVAPGASGPGIGSGVQTAPA